MVIVLIVFAVTMAVAVTMLMLLVLMLVVIIAIVMIIMVVVLNAGMLYHYQVFNDMAAYKKSLEVNFNVANSFIISCSDGVVGFTVRGLYIGNMFNFNLRIFLLKIRYHHHRNFLFLYHILDP